MSLSAARSTERPGGDELPMPLALLASCLICALIVATYVWVARRPVQVPKPVVLRVVLVQLPSPPPPPPPAVAPPPDALPPAQAPVAPAARIVVPPPPPAAPRREPPRRITVHREPVRLRLPVKPAPARSRPSRR